MVDLTKFIRTITSIRKKTYNKNCNLLTDSKKKKLNTKIKMGT